MRVTVFTKPGCVQCKFTFKQLDKDGVEYTAVDVTEKANQDALERIQASGNTAMPQVRIEDSEGNLVDEWFGFVPDKVSALGKLALAA